MIRGAAARLGLLLLLLSLRSAPADAVSNSRKSVGALAHLLVSPVHMTNQPSTEALRDLQPYCFRNLHLGLDERPEKLAITLTFPSKAATDPSQSNTPGDLCPTGLSPSGSGRPLVLLIPGLGAPRAAMLRYATLAAVLGLSSVSLDLPAQGESTGAHIGFGPLEAAAIEELLNKLDDRWPGAATHILIVGVSYGAAVALHVAARDEHVVGTVAIAPFADVESVIPRFAREDPRAATMNLDGMDFDPVLSQASELVGYDLAASSPLSVVGNIRAPVLYMAGADDEIAPSSDVRALCVGTRRGLFWEAPGATHLSLILNLDRLMPVVKGWLSQLLSESGDSEGPWTACEGESGE